MPSIQQTIQQNKQFPIGWDDITNNHYDQFIRTDFDVFGGKRNPARTAFFDRLIDSPERSRKLDKWLAEFPINETGFRPTAADGRPLAKCLVDLIFDDFDVVSQATFHHGSSMQKVWEHKSEKQKRTLLLCAYPEMPARHRPDVAESGYITFANELQKRRFLNTKAGVLPHINQEDLLEPLSLVMLLQARGRARPFKFARTEQLRAPYAGWDLLTDEIVGQTGYDTIDLRGATRDTYGVVHEGSDEAAFVAARNAGHGRFLWQGIQTLLIQVRLMRFLRKCCMLLLPDTDLCSPNHGSNTVANPWTIVRPSTMARDEMIGMFCREQRYRLPMLDYNRLWHITATAVHGLRDHIEKLRENPEYFAEKFQEQCEHRLKGIKIKGTSLDDQQDPRNVVGAVMSDMVYGSYYQMHHWVKCLEFVNRLEQYKEDHGWDWRVALPEAVRKDLKGLWWRLLIITADVKDICAVTLAASPPFRRFCNYRVVERDGFTLTVFEPKMEIVNQNTVLSEFLSRCEWMLLGRRPESGGYSSKLDDLTNYFIKHPDIQGCVSGFMENHIDHLRMASVCIDELRLLRPWNATTESEIKQSASTVSWISEIKDDQWKGLFCSAWHTEAIALLAAPKTDHFRYPQGRNRASVRQRRHAEAKLDELWDKMDEGCESVTGKSLQDLLDFPSSERAKFRTAPYVPPSATQPSRAPTAALETPPSPLPAHDFAVQVTGNFDRTASVVRPKLKHRPGTPLDPNSLDGLAPSAERGSDGNLGTSLSDVAEAADFGSWRYGEHVSFGAAGSKHAAEADAGEGTEVLGSYPDAGLSALVGAESPTSSSSTTMPHVPASFGRDMSPFARRVFQALFHSSTAEASKELPWLDFVRAMIEVGFATREGKGSAVHFTPVNVPGDCRKPIQIHKPHPSSKMRPAVVRRIGRRFTRQYDWCSETFSG